MNGDDDYYSSMSSSLSSSYSQRLRRNDLCLFKDFLCVLCPCVLCPERSRPDPLLICRRRNAKTGQRRKKDYTVLQVIITKIICIIVIFSICSSTRKKERKKERKGALLAPRHTHAHTQTLRTETPAANPPIRHLQRKKRELGVPSTPLVRS